MKNLLWQIFRSFSLSTWLILLALVLFLWLWIFGHQGLVELENLRQVRADLSEQKEELKKEREELEKELKHLQDPLHQKYLVHKELGLIQNGEVLVLFPDSQKKGSSLLDTLP